MRGIILAAGRGSRMGASTDVRPKCRTVLHGRELLDWQLLALRGAGIREIGLVRGYLAETFERDLTYFENLRWQSTNMVQSLVCAAAWLEAAPCVVSYSDIAYKPESVRRLQDADADIAITYDPAWVKLWSFRFEKPLDDAETFRIENGRVVEIGSRPKDLLEVEGQFMGLLRFTPRGWAEVARVLSTLPADQSDKIDVTALLKRLIATGVEIRGVPIAEPWCEVDSEEDVRRYSSVPMWGWA